MTTSIEIKAAIRRMFYAEHHRIEFIAHHFNVHHSTVTRALNQSFLRRGSPPKKERVVTEGHYLYIRERIEKFPKINAKKIFHELEQRDYQGSYNSVLRVVRKIRPTIHRVHVPVEVIAGEEAQVDWAHLGTITINGAVRKIYCFVMTLSWSRASWVELTMDMTSETLLRCHSQAFRYFNGVPIRVSYDNMRTVVTERIGDVIKFNKSLVEYASWYCFELRVCAPYQPQQKGRVERFIRFMRDNFWDGYTIKDFESARYHLRLWLFKANSRPWPVRREFSIDSQLVEERKKLLPLPTMLWPMGEKITKAGKVPLIRFDLNQYSIHPDYAGQILTIFFDDEEIKVMSGDTEVARHKRSWGRDEIIRCETHINALFKTTASGQSSALARHIFQDEIPEISAVLEWCQVADISFTRLFKTLLSLKEDFGLDLVKTAVSKAIEDGRPTPEMIAVICRRSAEKSIPKDRPLMLPERVGVSDLTIKTHDLGKYDDI